jgi:hypothetical protein
MPLYKLEQNYFIWHEKKKEKFEIGCRTSEKKVNLNVLGMNP